MKTHDFNIFLENLKADKIHEVAGYNFIRMTDRQCVKTIQHYAEIGETDIKLAPNGKVYVYFGMYRQFTFPLDRYMELTKKTLEDVFEDVLK